ncbi:MAG: ABC transporter substrate-binding protein [Armatimonadota bacterium]
MISVTKVTFLALLALLAIGAMAAPDIKIGGLFDLTGKAQNIGAPTKNVAQMVVNRINKSGGVNGRKIVLVVADTQSEPSQAVIALKRLIEKEKVVAIIGPTTTGAAMACLKTIEEAKIPMVACVGGDAPVEPTRKWVFKTPQKTSTAVERLFTYLKAHRLTSVALLGASDKFGQEGEAVLKKLAPKYGITIVKQESFDPNDADMTVQLTKVAAAKPKAIIVWTIGPAGAIIAKNAAQAKIGIPVFQCHGQPDAYYLKLAGAAANGTMMPSTKLMTASQLPMNDKQRNEVLEFVKAYQANKLGELGTHSGYAWDAIQIVCNALKKAGTDPEKLRAAIENTKGYVGVSGIYTMSADDHCGLNVSSLVMVKVVNGKWALIK